MPQRITDLAAFIGLEDFIDAAPERANQAMSYAMNAVIGGPRGLGKYRQAIRKEVRFPDGYLNDDRLGFDQRATPTDLTASIVARQRPTSLARFATSGTVGSKGGVSVRVNAQGGGGGTFKSGFLVRLRQGVGDGDGSNIGLAVRLAPGQQLNKKDQSRMVHLEANVVLLYGPSIDQVLQTSVADAETPEVIESVATEFFRQFERLDR